MDPCRPSYHTVEQIVYLAVRNLGKPTLDEILSFVPGLISYQAARDAARTLHDRGLIDIDQDMRLSLRERV